MKRADLEKQIKNMAKHAGVDYTRTQGGNHVVYRFPRARPIPIPRHTEVGDNLARTILKQVRTALGPH